MSTVGIATITPQMYSTIDYVNVNLQRARQQSSVHPSSISPWLISPPTASPQLFGGSPPQTPSSLSDIHSSLPARPNRAQQQPSQGATRRRFENRVKLVCDIDQVFPVPEVSLYRLAKLDGSHPDKLSKLETLIEKNPLNGLYHVQVISILEDDELQMKYGLNEPVYFECLIALTNLELNKYADNKRSVLYRPGK